MGIDRQKKSRTLERSFDNRYRILESCRNREKENNKKSSEVSFSTSSESHSGRSLVLH